MPFWMLLILGLLSLVLAGVIGGWIEWRFFTPSCTPPSSPSAALTPPPSPPTGFRFVEVDTFLQGQPTWIVDNFGNCLMFSTNDEHVHTGIVCSPTNRNQLFTYLPDDSQPRIQTNNSDASLDCMGCDQHSCYPHDGDTDGLIGANDGHASSPKSYGTFATWTVTPNLPAAQFPTYEASLAVGPNIVSSTDTTGAGCLFLGSSDLSLSNITATSPCGSSNNQIFRFAVPQMSS
jgi:hypothetical protein